MRQLFTPFHYTSVESTGLINRFSSLLKSIINRWAMAYSKVRCWEAKQLTQYSSPYCNVDLCNMVLFLQQAEMFVELHLNTEEGVDFAGGVEFFYPGTHGNRQVPNYPTF